MGYYTACKTATKTGQEGLRVEIIDKGAVMKILHILAAGGIGGIETLCNLYFQNSSHTNIVIFLKGGGVIADEMIKNGVKIIKFQKISLIKYFYLRKQLLKICREYQIDSVIVHHSSPVARLCLPAIKKKYPHIQTIIYAHGNANDMFGKNKRFDWPLSRHILLKSLKYTDKVIAISNSVKQSLMKELSVDEKKIAVIYNAIDLKKFSVVKDAELHDPLRIIYVGRLIAEKGVQSTLHALAALPSEFQYTFTVVGDGPYRSELEKLTDALSLREKVVFFGSRMDIPLLLQEADVFVHMPIWEEGFGITIIEAMSAGLICVCNDHGAIPEIVQDGINGFLIPDGEQFQRKFVERITSLKNIDFSIIQKNAVMRARDFSIVNFTEALDSLLENK